MNFANKVGFTIGTGRCGTLFLYQAMSLEPAVASSHERNPENEAFHRYCKWHRLPVDDEGFLAVKEQEIRADLAERAFSFEASPYLSLSVKELHERFGAKFVLLIRRPDGVVTSFVHKGFYRKPYSVGNPELAAGYQDQSPERFFTFFARISPRGASFRAWNDLTQVGKVAWFWRAYNERTLQALDELPRESYRVVRIEDLDYAAYLELGRFLGVELQATQIRFRGAARKQAACFLAQAKRRPVERTGNPRVRSRGRRPRPEVRLQVPRCGHRRRGARRKGGVDSPRPHPTANSGSTVLADAPRHRRVAAWTSDIRRRHMRALERGRASGPTAPADR